MSYLEIDSLVSDHPELQMKLIAGESGLQNHLNTIDINRPGACSSWFFKEFCQ